MTLLNQARAASGSGGGKGLQVSSEEVTKLQDKLDSLQEKYDEEKKMALKVENHFHSEEQKYKKAEDQQKENIRMMATMEMENDELKNDVRQMGFMVEDLEQKLDSQLEINELLTTEQEEQKSHMEEQIERLRQQLEDANTEVEVKDKELKALKLR